MYWNSVEALRTCTTAGLSEIVITHTIHADSTGIYAELHVFRHELE